MTCFSPDLVVNTKKHICAVVLFDIAQSSLIFSNLFEPINSEGRDSRPLCFISLTLILFFLRRRLALLV